MKKIKVYYQINENVFMYYKSKIHLFFDFLSLYKNFYYETVAHPP